MNIWEINFEKMQGKKLKTDNGQEYIVKDKGLFSTEDNKQITNTYELEDIVKMEFEEVVSKLNGWEGVKSGEIYYTITDMGVVGAELDNDNFDIKRLEECNHFSIKEKAEEIESEQILYRMMKKFRDENDEYVDWMNKKRSGYYIQKDIYEDKFIIDSYFKYRDLHTIYFTTRELAQRCMDEVVKPFMDNQ